MKTLKVANGLVNGQVKSVLGKEIVEFLCIPYCKPPIKELRFKKPQPYSEFSNQVINKLNFETCPPQIIMPFPDTAKELEVWNPKEKPDEDSLYLNIWCPLNILEGNEKRPVFVFIYGGGFVCGSSSLDVYKGDVLATHENIIFVSFNYRVGALGFLCLDEFGMNGNLGIWDQVLALRWIHNNISVFNGDPDNITIAGCSAGGFSVSAHLLIEESWPYFQKAIIESGVCLSDWGFRSREESIRRSVLTVNKILDKFNFPLRWNQNISINEKEAIVNYLQNLDFKEFIMDFEILKGFGQFSLSPRLDDELFKDHPRTLINDGKFKKCPTIVLTSENEGSTLLTLFCNDMQLDSNNLVDMKYFDLCFEYYPYFPIKCKESTKNKIKKKYNIENEKIPINVLHNIISDNYFVCDSIEFSNVISRSNKDLYYLWHRNYIPLIYLGKSQGAYHGSEVAFLLGIILRNSTITENSYIENCKATMHHFGNFMKNGHLEEHLQHFNKSTKCYVDVFGTDWQTKSFTDDQMNLVDFWMNLRNEYTNSEN